MAHEESAWHDLELRSALAKLGLTPQQMIALKQQMGVQESANVTVYGKPNPGEIGISMTDAHGELRGDYTVSRDDKGVVNFEGQSGSTGWEGKAEHSEPFRLNRERSDMHHETEATLNVTEKGEAKLEYAPLEGRSGSLNRDGSGTITVDKQKFGGVGVEGEAGAQISMEDHSKDFVGLKAKGGLFGPSRELEYVQLGPVEVDEHDRFHQIDYHAAASVNTGIGAEGSLGNSGFKGTITAGAGAGVAVGRRDTTIDVHPPEQSHEASAKAAGDDDDDEDSYQAENYIPSRSGNPSPDQGRAADGDDQDDDDQSTIQSRSSNDNSDDEDDDDQSTIQSRSPDDNRDDDEDDDDQSTIQGRSLDDDNDDDEDDNDPPAAEIRSLSDNDDEDDDTPLSDQIRSLSDDSSDDDDDDDDQSSYQSPSQSDNSDDDDDDDQSSYQSRSLSNNSDDDDDDDQSSYQSRSLSDNSDDDDDDDDQSSYQNNSPSYNDDDDDEQDDEDDNQSYSSSSDDDNDYDDNDNDDQPSYSAADDDDDGDSYQSDTASYDSGGGDDGGGDSDDD